MGRQVQPASSFALGRITGAKSHWNLRAYRGHFSAEINELKYTMPLQARKNRVSFQRKSIAVISKNRTPWSLPHLFPGPRAPALPLIFEKAEKIVSGFFRFAAFKRDEDHREPVGNQLDGKEDTQNHRAGPWEIKEYHARQHDRQQARDYKEGACPGRHT